MAFSDNTLPETKQRIVQELVPGKQISLAHIIANPDKIMYTKLGLDPSIDYAKSAIGIMTVSPAETAIIMGDLAIKSSGVDIGFVDLFSGSLIVTYDGVGGGSFHQGDFRLCRRNAGVCRLPDHPYITA